MIKILNKLKKLITSFGYRCMYLFISNHIVANFLEPLNNVYQKLYAGH